MLMIFKASSYYIFLGLKYISLDQPNACANWLAIKVRNCPCDRVRVLILLIH